MANAVLTPREVAELAGAPQRMIEKAIEERVLTVRFRRWGTRRLQRMLPPHAVAYAAVMTKLDLKLTAAHKKRLVGNLARLAPAKMRTARVELAPAVEIDVGRLVGDAMDRAMQYHAARDAFIVTDDAIKGGTAVIRGTRITVYAVLGQIEHGDTVDDILADNPDLSRQALDAAITYARTHPLVGRPGGRPWADAA